MPILHVNDENTANNKQHGRETDNDLKVSQINGKCLEWVDGPEGRCNLEINVMTETKTSKATERDIRGV